MADAAKSYREAERVFLASEGVEANSTIVDLPHLGGTARVLDTGGGPPVLFVPGVMTSGAVFAGLAGRLSGFRCILLDRPGTGLSPLPEHPATDLAGQQRFADNLLTAVLDGLGIEHAHVVSTSLGGWPTFRSAAVHPDRFLTIAGLGFQIGARLVDPPLWMRLPAPRWMMPRRLKVSKGIIRSMLKSAGMSSAIETGKFSNEMLDWMVALLHHTPTFGNDSRYNPRPIGWRGPNEAVRHAPELLAHVRTPVHLLWGDDDPFGGREAAEEFAGLLPHATLQMVDGAGHAPWLDEPDIIAEAIASRLNA